MFMLAQYTN